MNKDKVIELLKEELKSRDGKIFELIKENNDLKKQIKDIEKALEVPYQEKIEQIKQYEVLVSNLEHKITTLEKTK